MQARLLTEELRAQLPALCAQAKKRNPTIHARFFTPDSNWTWYVTEGSPVKEKEGAGDDFRFFGYVIGQLEEWRYFLLSELESAEGLIGFPIERDLHFEPAPFSEAIKRHHQVPRETRKERGQ